MSEQFLMQLLAAHGARIDNQLGIVPVIRFFLAEVFPPHDMQLRKVRRITVKCIQTSPVFRKKFCPLLTDQVDACIHSRHKQIRRRTRLIDAQIPCHAPGINPRAVTMQKRRLCKRRQRLVQTHNHSVRPKAHRIFRESGSESEVGPVRFIDNQRRPVCMTACRNRRDVRHDPLVGRGCEDHNRNIRMLCQRLLHLRRGNLSLQISPRDCRIEELHRKSLHGNRVIDRFVAVPCRQYLISPPCGSADGGKQSAGAPVYQVIRPVRTVELRRALLGLPDKPFGMMQVVKSVNLRNIDGIRIWKRKCPALVPRHMKRVDIRFPV